MKAKIRSARHILPTPCAPMYPGKRVSLLLFYFPVASTSAPANYYLQFVPQVTASTKLHGLTKVMLVCATIILVASWRQPQRHVPTVVLAEIIATITLMICWIFPLVREAYWNACRAQRKRNHDA